MPTVAEAFSIASAHLAAGRLDLAEAVLRDILRAAPKQPDSMHALGLVALHRGDAPRAIELIEHAVRIRNDIAAWQFSLGEAYRIAGRLPDAIRALRRAVSRDGNVAEARLSLALVLKDSGRLSEAADSCRQAIRIRPNYAAAHNCLGTIQNALGAFADARSSFERAIALDPRLPDPHYNLGNAWTRERRLDDAERSFRAALRLSPSFAFAHLNLGNVLRDQGRIPEAAQSYEAALALRPHDPGIPVNIGNLYLNQGKFGEASAWYERALQVQPGHFDALFSLANVRLEEKKVADALALLRRALEARPESAAVLNGIGLAAKEEARLGDAMASFREAVRLDPTCAEAHSNYLYLLYFSPEFDRRAILDEHLAWNRMHAEPFAGEARVPHANAREPGRRLRIGYVSANFRGHAESFFTIPLMEHHDHLGHEIYCYADVLQPDSFTDRLRACADVWRNVVGYSDDQLAGQIREDGIDVLVDLSLHMPPRCRPLVFARKPAPVQVCWLAYQGTTGLSTMDYRLTDSILDPEGLDDAYYTERSIRLPGGFWCYDPLHDPIPVPPPPAVRNGYPTFGCFSAFLKLNEQTLRLWARVLNAVPGSRLSLLAPEGASRTWVQEVLGGEGVAVDRIHFVGYLSRSDYLRAYEGVDVALDTFPYNGQTTTLDSLWMGVPVVTMTGATAVARAGASLLQRVGLPELVAPSCDQFVELTVQLATDPPRLERLRRELRDRLVGSVLCDGPHFAKAMESAFREMWQRWCESGSG